jgi:hypothetical protein
MKRIIVLICLLFCFGFYIVSSKENNNIDLELKDQIGIVFINQSMIFINGENSSTLLVIDNNTNLNAIKRFKYTKLNLILLKNMPINIKHDNEYLLNSKLTIEGVTYEIRNNLIYISYKGINTCVYKDKAYNISDCQFIYFYNTDIPRLTLYDYNEIVLYYYKKPLSTEELERIYEESIDTYPIRDDEINIIKIGNGDYDFIVIDNE